MKKNLLQLIWPTVFLLLLASIIFTQRWIFHYRIDTAYLQDWYNHSQWNIPLSPRIMGDAELYQLSAYRIVTGDDPFHISPEVPVLGKYLYGLSELWFHNPYATSLFFYFLGLGSFFLLADKVFSKKRESLVYLAFFLFLIQPLFFSQASQVGLDFPQLCFLLLHLLLLFTIPEKRSGLMRIFLVISSGIFLGAFTAVKFALFAPIIFLTSSWYLYRKKNTELVPFLLSSALIFYPLTYISYFLNGHSLTQWLAAEKWVVHFYATSHVQFIPLMVVITLLSGIFVNWWHSWNYTWEWTILWPLGLIITAGQIIKKSAWQKLSIEWQALLFMTISLVVTNSFIPFWPRYLILILPFFILFVMRFLDDYPKWKKAIILFSLFEFAIFLFPQPFETVGLISQAWKGGAYADMYNFLDRSSQMKQSRSQFVSELQDFDHQLDDSRLSVDISTPTTLPWQNKVQGKLSIAYATPFGEIQNTTNVEFKREENQWRLEWSPQLILPQFTEHSQIMVHEKNPHLGTLKMIDGTVLSHEGQWPFISLIPQRVADFEKLNDQLSQLTYSHREIVRVNALVLNQPNTIIPVGFLKPSYDQSLFKEVASESGVIVDEKVTRVYDPRLAVLPKVLTLIEQQEKGHPALDGQIGGTVTMKTADDKILTLIDEPMQNGTDVTLQASPTEIFGDQTDSYAQAVKSK